MREVIFSKNAPKAVGPYSDAVKVGNLLFIGGKDTRDYQTLEIVQGDFEEEVRTSMNNLMVALEAGGSSMNDLVKVNVYLADIRYFDRFNKVYAEYFEDPQNVPTRTTIEAKLWGSISIEIEAIAYIKS
jgi:2-iminobutanoate/2-iminopropanoate deaminase